MRHAHRSRALALALALTTAATLLAGGTAHRADAASRRSLAVYLHVGCESWTRLKIRCTATVIGGWGPWRVDWYVDGVHYSTSADQYGSVGEVSQTFACSPSRPAVYEAVATDALGQIGYAPGAGAKCYTTTP
ncbi:hypothetical protein MF672_013490 [Actinomadura sp. ATCC 31491]|uniref:Secreted protein n=1 Tax=Actinomadura luzonensis TaxID=2805427 RepID=A0ABT0FSE0_9ACTN|nr:hypothetical protein [Actinomadura luzonensis]MCK2214798.1 hypothetical protein [Actinomadura luzonensis]